MTWNEFMRIVVIMLCVLRSVYVMSMLIVCTFVMFIIYVMLMLCSHIGCCMC
jgi:hypothetical protein